MRIRIKWLAGALYALGIATALSFGAHQALAANRLNDPCVCPTPFSMNECDECCGDPGFCSSVNSCIC
jgi:hypothetical protein